MDQEKHFSRTILKRQLDQIGKIIISWRIKTVIILDITIWSKKVRLFASI